MARFPDSELERLKATTDLAALVRGAGVELQAHGEDLLGLCPFHDDHEPSLVVSPRKGLWNCLGACRAGGSAIDPIIVSTLLSKRRRDDLLTELTPREREVLELMAEGRSNVAIAEELVVSAGAVEKHVGHIFTKLDLPPDPDDHRRVLAVLRYLGS